MLKQNLYIRTFAVLTSILVLITSVGVNVNLHLCQDQIKSANFLGHAEGCSEAEVVCEITLATTNPSIERTPCCKNLQIFGKTTFEQVHQITIELQNFFLLDLPNLHSQAKYILTDFSEGIIAFHPPPEEDMLILYQQFLI